jgi:hypothetical protein
LQPGSAEARTIPPKNWLAGGAGPVHAKDTGRRGRDRNRASLNLLSANRVPNLEFVVIDPKVLLERASQLTDQANGEDDRGIRERLLRMAEHYKDLAAHESWARENPPSMASITNVLNPKAK